MKNGHSTTLVQQKGIDIADMFNAISGSYDFLNHILSFGLDIYWRKKAVASIKNRDPSLILDVATGTGDLALQQLRSLRPEKVIGIDVSLDMLNRAKRKVPDKHLNYMEFYLENSENLSFPNNTFDAVSVAFGVRNFDNLEKGLHEIYRVLKKDGQIMILEFSNPNNKIVKSVYKLYFHNVLPKIGKLISKNDHAYKYLPDSVQNFPSVGEFVDLLKEAGFKNVECEALSLGICSIYTGIK